MQSWTDTITLSNLVSIGFNYNLERYLSYLRIARSLADIYLISKILHNFITKSTYSYLLMRCQSNQASNAIMHSSMHLPITVKDIQVISPSMCVSSLRRSNNIIKLLHNAHAFISGHIFLIYSYTRIDIRMTHWIRRYFKTRSLYAIGSLGT